ncbi:MAG: hypothetical protein ACKVRN_02045 [Pyrinomonadaceae bacterium]
MRIKKYFATFMMAAMAAIAIPVLADTASAQKNCNRRSSYNRSANRRSYARQSYARQNVTYKRPSFYSRHRKAINIGAGAGVGALVGGLLGGKKWAAIGGLAGAGGGALFTHKQKPRNYARRVYRNY